MAKRVPKQTKRRLAILGPISLVIIVYFLINLVTYSYKLITLSREEKKLKDKLVSLQAEESNLKVEIQKLKDPDYLARYARENYLYSKDGEYIIKIEEKDKETSNENNLDKYYDYIVYGAGGVIILIFEYVIIRSIKKWYWVINIFLLLSSVRVKINTW